MLEKLKKNNTTKKDKENVAHTKKLKRKKDDSNKILERTNGSNEVEPRFVILKNEKNLCLIDVEKFAYFLKAFNYGSAIIDNNGQIEDFIVSEKDIDEACEHIEKCSPNSANTKLMINIFLNYYRGLSDDEVFEKVTEDITDENEEQPLEDNLELEEEEQNSGNMEEEKNDDINEQSQEVNQEEMVESSENKEENVEDENTKAEDEITSNQDDDSENKDAIIGCLLLNSCEYFESEEEIDKYIEQAPIDRMNLYDGKQTIEIEENKIYSFNFYSYQIIENEIIRYLDSVDFAVIIKDKIMPMLSNITHQKLLITTKQDLDEN